MLPLAWSVVAALASALAMARSLAPAHYFLAGAVLLRLCLAGKEMFARYEGQAPPAFDWTRPGMRLVRAALIANLCAFLGGVTLAPAIFEWSRFTHQHQTLAPGTMLMACLVMTAVMLVAVMLLARQRTAGLLLLAVAAIGVPLTLIANRAVYDTATALIFLALFGPGIVCGWLALGRFVPGMVRLLRR
jgi:hypothetical protein